VVNVPTSPTPGIPGGYTNQPVDSPAMLEVAQQAIVLLQERTKDTTLALTALKAARSQVVAGVNFGLTMDVRSKDGPRTVTVVVFRSLQGDFSLTSVTGL
jgi:hypothetical protein